MDTVPEASASAVQQPLHMASPPSSSMRSPLQPTSRLMSPSLSPGPISPKDDGSVSSFSTATSHSARTIQIPDHWREETQDSIEEGVMDDDSRSDIVRTLVTLMVAKYGPKPGRARCEELSRLLILKYPFMKDDLGNGYVSVH